VSSLSSSSAKNTWLWHSRTRLQDRSWEHESL